MALSISIRRLGHSVINRVLLKPNQGTVRLAGTLLGVKEEIEIYIRLMGELVVHGKHAFSDLYP